MGLERRRWIVIARRFLKDVSLEVPRRSPKNLVGKAYNVRTLAYFIIDRNPQIVIGIKIILSYQKRKRSIYISDVIITFANISGVLASADRWWHYQLIAVNNVNLGCRVSAWYIFFVVIRVVARLISTSRDFWYAKTKGLSRNMYGVKRRLIFAISRFFPTHLLL